MSDRKTRALARRGRVVLHKTRLQAVEPDPNPIRGADGITLVTRLTLESWSLGGHAVPAYRRAETPHRFVRSRFT